MAALCLGPAEGKTAVQHLIHKFFVAVYCAIFASYLFFKAGVSPFYARQLPFELGPLGGCLCCLGQSLALGLHGCLVLGACRDVLY